MGTGPAAGSARGVNTPWTTFSVGPTDPRKVERYSRRSAQEGSRAWPSASSFSTGTPFMEAIFIVTIAALSATGEPALAATAERGTIWSSWMSKKIRLGRPAASEPWISFRSVVRTRKSVRTRKVPRPSDRSRRTVRLFGRCRLAKPWRTT